MIQFLEECDLTERKSSGNCNFHQGKMPVLGKAGKVNVMWKMVSHQSNHSLSHYQSEFNRGSTINRSSRGKREEGR